MSDLPERTAPTDPRLLRASDADRERVAEVLRSAAAEGRLHLDELDERLAAVYAARTYADLEPITHDLPTARTVRVPAAHTPAAPGGASGTGIAILGGFERKGRWTVASRFTAIAFCGGGEIDLREAQLTAGEVTITAFAVMGGISIIVPEEADVVVNGVGIMGGFDQRAGGPGVPGAPRVIVNGLAFWGGVEVRRLPVKEELERRRLERRRQRAERRQLRAERRQLGQ
jgi:Domain of unknown function (DUF1707)/Cell wall-active antibiotics response 4TMS YvqF